MSRHFHPDWRDWIAKKLRVKLKREQKREPARPYLMRSIDKFKTLTPHLRMRSEKTLQLEEICKIVNRPGDDEVWSPNSASRFLRYLADVGVISYRYAGRRGNGIKLLKNLAVAPDPSRQSGTGQIPRPVPGPDGDNEGESSLIPQEVEFDPMPASPAPMNRLLEPDLAVDETVELDGAVLLSAIDRITENLGNINLSFRTELTGAQAATAYDAQTTISKAMSDLQRLRQAVLRGDGTPLQEILGD